MLKSWRESAFLRPLFDESGSSSIEMAILTPIFLLVIAFWADRQIIHEGAYAIQTAANQAIRMAVIQDDLKGAKKTAMEVLSDQFKETNMGWCANKGLDSCKEWGEVAKMSDATKRFKKEPASQVAISVDRGWCNGSYMTLGVRAHKASLLPSYSSMRSLLRRGGSVYHEHVFMVRARVESSKPCK